MPVGASYRTSGTARHSIRLHFLFVTSRARAILTGEVADRVAEILTEIAAEEGCEALDVQVSDRLAYVELVGRPELAASQIALRLRKHSAQRLLSSFPELTPEGAVWVRPYLVSTYPISQESATCFLEDYRS
ncbi:transposase [Rubrivirga litoralis]|uniref:Transposase n=1 Tax=Rubrivirga litoralis TaxID=3075598 RepID=A0ABU3BUI6_9BACT|nr:transposase [Rubrivirga sp. F394]MDT0632955.1 transposase [Rubrivirga sp. F394]